MPTPTYDLIEEKVLSSAVASTTFSSISGAYKDLVLEIVGSTATDGQSMVIQVGNGSVDTGSNYSHTILWGNGTTASSARQSSQTQTVLTYYAASNNALTTIICNLLSYANTNVNKTFVTRAGGAAGAYPGVDAIVGLWRSTSAINTIKVFSTGGANITAGTYRLWGVSG